MKKLLLLLSLTMGLNFSGSLFAASDHETSDTQPATPVVTQPESDPVTDTATKTVPVEPAVTLDASADTSTTPVAPVDIAEPLAVPVNNTPADAPVTPEAPADQTPAPAEITAPQGSTAPEITDKPAATTTTTPEAPAPANTAKPEQSTAANTTSTDQAPAEITDKPADTTTTTDANPADTATPNLSNPQDNASAGTDPQPKAKKSSKGKFAAFMGSTMKFFTEDAHGVQKGARPAWGMLGLAAMLKWTQEVYVEFKSIRAVNPRNIIAPRVKFFPAIIQACGKVNVDLVKNPGKHKFLLGLATAAAFAGLTDGVSGHLYSKKAAAGATVV